MTFYIRSSCFSFPCCPPGSFINLFGCFHLAGKQISLRSICKLKAYNCAGPVGSFLFQKPRIRIYAKYDQIIAVLICHDHPVSGRRDLKSARIKAIGRDLPDSFKQSVLHHFKDPDAVLSPVSYIQISSIRREQNSSHQIFLFLFLLAVSSAPIFSFFCG